MDMMQCVAHKEAKKKRKYVDATDMKERFCGNCSHENPCWVCMIFHFFNDFPAADVQEVKHGRWTQHDDAHYAGGGYWECSCCKWHISNFIFIEDARYCPNCGAKMVNEDDDTD